MFRLVLVLEFLIALVAVSTLWSQVGGQYHLDLMPWYWKLVLIAGVSFAGVQATAAAVRQEKAWNARTSAWLMAAVALMILMGVITYYYHVHEPADEEDQTLSSARFR